MLIVSSNLVPPAEQLKDLTCRSSMRVERKSSQPLVLGQFKIFILTLAAHTERKSSNVQSFSVSLKI